MLKALRLYLLVGVVAAPLQAQSNALNFGADDVNINFNNGQWSLGWEFQVLAPIWVTSLGVYDNGNWRTDRDVGIFSNSSTILGQATVTAASTVSGLWRFQAVTPFLLAIGTYRIFGTTGLDNYTWNPDNLFVSPEIAFVSDYFIESSTLQWGDELGGGGVGVEGWFGPNFQFQAADAVVPEPATYVLVATGLILVGGIARARRRNSSEVN